MKILFRLLAIVVGLYGALLGGAGCVQRRLLFFPSHLDGDGVAAHSGLQRWVVDGEYLGYARAVASPRRIWFMLHGNGAQAASRGYVLPHLAADDSLYVLEYPGYGERPGHPSRKAFDAAALEGYAWLVKHHGVEKLIVLGESLGSGPAAMMARAPVPPKQIVLVVPFDVLVDVAKEKFPLLPVGLIMLDRWNNVAALRDFTGRLDIFGGTYDPVIPIVHARKLAAAHPGAVFHEFRGGHNWADSPEVALDRL